MLRENEVDSHSLSSDGRRSEDGQEGTSTHHTIVTQSDSTGLKKKEELTAGQQNLCSGPNIIIDSSLFAEVTRRFTSKAINHDNVTHRQGSHFESLGRKPEIQQDRD